MRVMSLFTVVVFPLVLGSSLLKAQSPNDSLIVIPVSIAAGQATVSIPVSLTNSVPVAGISARMVFDGNIITPQVLSPEGTVSMDRISRGTALSWFGAGTPKAGVVTWLLTTTSGSETISVGSGPVCQINFTVLTAADTTICIRLENDPDDPLAAKNHLSDAYGALIIPSLLAGGLRMGLGNPVAGCAVAVAEIDDRGDLNQNGISYEIGDFVLYENYFVYGDVVLSSNPNRRQAQIAASDANGDGQILRVSDLVFMGRIIIGDANPLPKPNVSQQVNAADFQIVQEPDRLLVSYNSPIDISGIFLRLHFLGTAGDPVRLDPAQNVDYGSQIYPGELRFFLAGHFFSFSPELPGKLPAGSGPLLSIPFSGSLRRVEIQASDTLGFEIQTAGTFPIDNRGDLNADGFLTPSDVVLELYCIFQSPSPSCPLTLADLNCDGALTAADVVNILAAAFKASALPVCNP